MCERMVRGKKSGPSPVDRSRPGSKHHVITDGQGVPLVVLLTAGNVPDVNLLYEAVDGIPALRGARGRPRKKPASLYADRGYDSNAHRRGLRLRGIVPYIARRNTANGSGLGVHRWVVERTNAWLHQYRRLRVRWERRADIHEGFLHLAASLICWSFLKPALC
jgi:transposase